MKTEWDLINAHESEYGTLRSYVLGFALSLLFTFASYYLVVEQLLSGWSLGSALMGLGVIQAMIQMLFFLHLGNEPKPYWNVLLFLFMLLVLVIIAAGSLWIMINLNARVMS